MHGITGGDDADLIEDAETVVNNALKRGLSHGSTIQELTRSAKDAVLSLLWERTKQRPMMIVNVLEV